MEAESENGTILLSSCRACSDTYSYALCNGQTVTILVGIPPPGIKYKAISHVWGTTIPIEMHCKHCSASISIPLRSISTFINIMTLAGPGSNGIIEISNPNIMCGIPRGEAGTCSMSLVPTYTAVNKQPSSVKFPKNITFDKSSFMLTSPSIFRDINLSS
jgi:hypothetical protein